MTCNNFFNNNGKKIQKEFKMHTSRSVSKQSQNYFKYLCEKRMSLFNMPCLKCCLWHLTLLSEAVFISLSEEDLDIVKFSYNGSKKDRKKEK